MKTKIVSLFIVFVGIFIAISAQAKQKINYDSIADKLVNQSLSIQPGESVVITGTPAELTLLEALSVATSKAGGKPTIQLNMPKANKRAIMETKIKYLEAPSAYEIAQMQQVDAFINVSSTQDPNLFSDVPEDKLAAIRHANIPLNKALRKASFRSVTLGQTGGIPTQSYAKSRGANFEVMVSNFWKAIDVDYDKLDSSARKLAKKMKANTKVTLTSKSGTNLKFNLAKDVDVRINSGTTDSTSALSGPSQVWLPAGEVYACTTPTSASGTLVVPSMRFRGLSVKNLKIKFENGRMTQFSADKNEKKLRDFFESSTGDYGVLSLVDIGLNPNSKTIRNSDYYSWEMAGIVTIAMGDHSWAGCSVESDAGLTFNLSDTTLTFDNKTIVSKGKLNKAIAD